MKKDVKIVFAVVASLSVSILIVILVLALKPKGESLTLMCNGNDCSSFHTEVIQRSIERDGMGRCHWEMNLEREKVLQCGAFR